MPVLRVSLGGLLATVAASACLSASSAWADPFEVADEAGYQRLLDAGTAAQIVRFEESVTPRPRLVAGVTAIGVLAARNPLATEAQLTEFVGLYDGFLGSAYPADPELRQSSHFLAAVRFRARVVGAPGLVGLETDIGADVLARLGLAIDDFDRRRRVVQFERAGELVFANSSEYGRALVEGLMGFDAAGKEHGAVAGATAAYLRLNGIEPYPTPAVLASEYPEVAAARAAAPASFAAFEVERAAGFANVRAEIDGTIDDVMAAIDGHVDDIATGLAAEPDIFAAAANAADPALLDALAAARLADMRRIAGARAAINLNTLLLAQSEDANDRTHAEVVRDFSNLTLQTDTTYSDISKGIEIGGSAVGFIAAVYTGDVVGAIGTLTTVVSGIVDVAAPETPTPEQQIFDQVIALREQVEDLRVEMNARFDSIERQLNVIYTEMSGALNELNETTRQIDGNVQQIQGAIVDVRVALNRIEQNLYGAIFAGFLQDYVAGANFALGHRDRFGVDLPFTGADSFGTYENLFYSWSTTFAADNTYAGPSGLTLSNDGTASDVLGATPLGVNINNLRQFPSSLGLPALSGGRLANPTIWADTAWSYAQLARENPWYFAKLNQNQPTRLTDVISEGEAVETAMAAARSHALFDGLAMDYRGRASLFAAEAAVVQQAFIASSVPELAGMDPWADSSQSLDGVTLSGTFPAPEMLYVPLGYSLPSPSSWGLFPSALAIAAHFDALPLSPGLFTMEISYTEVPQGTDKHVTYHLDLIYDGQILATRNHVLVGSCDLCGTQDLGEYLLDNVWFDFLADSFNEPEGTVTNWNSFWRVTGGPQWTTSDATLMQPVIDAANAELASRRALVGAHLRQRLTQASALRDAAVLMTASEDLLDAFVSIGLPETFGRSDIVRSALRGDGLGMDLVDSLFAGQYFGSINPPAELEGNLHRRMDAVMAELSAALDPTGDDETHASLEWSIANLRDIQANARRLSADDSYATPPGANLVVAAAAGVLANDAVQPGAAITAALISPAMHGSLALGLDGSFSYQPDPGFTGTDVFGYIATANLAVGGPPNLITAEPAFVVVSVCSPGSCPGDPACAADLDASGSVDVFDLLAYLDLWFSAAPAADRTGDPIVDVFDLLAYLDGWFAGC